MAYQALLGPLGIAEAQVYRMRGEAEDIEAAARDYEHTIATLTGVQPGHGVPQLDLVLLGLGADGHTASLFGDTVALDVRDRWVVRNYVAKFTTSRLTLTFPVILAAREIRVLVTGVEKAAHPGRRARRRLGSRPAARATARPGNGPRGLARRRGRRARRCCPQSARATIGTERPEPSAVTARVGTNMHDTSKQASPSPAQTPADDARATPPAGPCTMVIFGASGDLTKRKLLPALYNLRQSRTAPAIISPSSASRARR